MLLPLSQCHFQMFCLLDHVSINVNVVWFVKRVKRGYPRSKIKICQMFSFVKKKKNYSGEIDPAPLRTMIAALVSI